MTALQLFRFITENGIEWRYQDNDGTDDVIIFVRAWLISDFSKLLDPTLFSDGPIECNFTGDSIAFWMVEICNHYDINLEEVFIPKEEK